MMELRIGDSVIWRNDDTRASMRVTVEHIQKDIDITGVGVDTYLVDWQKVDRSVIVILNNGHWAYGSQIEPTKDH